MPLSAATTDTVTFELEDRRNALDRVLLHFSHLEKETKRLKNAPAEMIQYGWDDSDGFGSVDDDEIPFT